MGMNVSLRLAMVTSPFRILIKFDTFSNNVSILYFLSFEIMSSTSLLAPKLCNNSFIYPKPFSLMSQDTCRVCVLRNAIIGWSFLFLVLQILIISLYHYLSCLFVYLRLISSIPLIILLSSGTSLPVLFFFICLVLVIFL